MSIKMPVQVQRKLLEERNETSIFKRYKIDTATNETRKFCGWLCTICEGYTNQGNLIKNGTR